MVHELEVPLAHAGLQIDGDERLGEQVVARPVAAVGVDRRRFHREVDEAQLRIDGDLRPDAVVAGPRPRFLFPRAVAEFAGRWNRIEAPDLFTGARVERADQTLGVRAVAVPEALGHRRPDDDHVADDGRRGVQADLAAIEIDLLALADDDALLEVQDAVFAECLHRLPGLRVQLDEAVADRDRDDTVVALAVGPVGDAPAGELARRDRGAQALVHVPDPLQLTGASVERDNRPACAARRVEHAADHDPRALELVLGPLAEVVRPESPGDLE